jgi:hypothetical protein
MVVLNARDFIAFTSFILCLVEVFMSQKYEVILGIMALIDAIKGARTCSSPNLV